MSQAAARVPLVNAANALTAVRLALVPVFVVVTVGSGMTQAGWRIAAALIFLAASLTDFADGWIARHYGLVTAVGKIADPIADKALIGSALVLLSGFGELPWWVTGLILVREIGVTLLRFWVIRHGVIPASRGGKVKTGLQIAAITWYLLPIPDPLAWVGPVLMAAAVLVTVGTGIDYVVRAIRLRSLVPDEGLTLDGAAADSPGAADRRGGEGRAGRADDPGGAADRRGGERWADRTGDPDGAANRTGDPDGAANRTGDPEGAADRTGDPEGAADRSGGERLGG